MLMRWASRKPPDVLLATKTKLTPNSRGGRR